MTLGALAFLNPALLVGLLALPIIYWLLRTVPPRPKQIAFPPTRILVGIENKEKTPAKTPWWLMLIRLLAAALVIFALAEPVLNPTREKALKGSGPVALVIDNGWASASRWAERQRMLDRMISEAEALSRPVVVLATAHATKTIVARVEAPAQARSTAAALKPQPFAPQRIEAVTALERALSSARGKGEASVVWIADGIDHDAQTFAFGERLARLAGGGTFAVIEDKRGQEPLGAVAGLGQDGKLEAVVMRSSGPARNGVLHAYSVRGQRLGEAPFSLGEGAQAAAAAFSLPLELRNQVTRVEIAGERSAGAVSLLDARSQWHRVGLLSGESREQAQPLLAPLYYVQRALGPFAELVQPKDANVDAGISAIMKQNATVMVLADIGTVTGDLKDQVDKWVKKGGVLVRFAGPRLEKGGDELLPAPLRLGGRSLGGALSWSTPQPLAAFDATSLFAGLAIPAEVAVTRQVLADPAKLGADVKVWARLKDGTPLVTAQRRGEGQLILFHITANADWSNLPMSGLFVEMLRRISTLGKVSTGSGEATVADTREGQIAANEQAEVLTPSQTLDGFGVLGNPPPTAQAIAAAKLADMKPGADHPPGYYGPQGSPRALNVINAKSVLAPLPSLPASAERRSIESEAARPLKPHMLSLALSLIFIDIVAVILLQLGGLSLRLGRPAAKAGAIVAAMAAGALAITEDVAAQSSNRPSRFPPSVLEPDVRSGPVSNDPAVRATSKVTLGYVLTGDNATDQTSRLGLMGLGRELSRRTAVEPGDPQGVNIVSDEIAFYPILYWPVMATAQRLPDTTLAKIDAYMKQGGMILFDTRDYGSGIPTGIGAPGQGGNALQRLLGRLDVPRLEPVPEGHVMTKSFYLLRTFPGRWDGGQLWVEADADQGSEQGRRAKRVDGVSSLMVTSNDFAAAWAADERGRALYPVVPGGESQREGAIRTGINIVMYALTGNYKADQVHVPALLERLGQ